MDIAGVHAMASEQAPEDVIVFGTNGNLPSHWAAQVNETRRDLDTCLGQPRMASEESLTTRWQMTTPLVLDESLDGMRVLPRTIDVGAMGFAVTLEDSGCGSIIAATASNQLDCRECRRGAGVRFGPGVQFLQDVGHSCS